MRPIWNQAVSAAAVASIFASTTLIPLPAQSAMPFQQYQTVGDIPDASFKQHKVIYGRVEKIVDGDTFRVSYKGKLSENTLSIRIYGVDCPEVAKFGNPSMPFGEEAKEYTRNQVDQKVVRIKLLRRDQYNRAVAKVTTKGFLPFTKKDMTIQLVDQGLATLYTGGGAEYDDKRELLEKKIEEAKRRKRGVWSGTGTLETPAEYKRKMKKNKQKAATVEYAKPY